MSSRAVEEKALEERVERIKRVEVVSQVVGGLIHDFNNILTVDHGTLGRVFEPFFTTKGDGGSGLGMTMVLDLVVGQGGFLEVDSEVGEGTTVSVFLPIAAPSGTP